MAEQVWRPRPGMTAEPLARANAIFRVNFQTAHTSRHESSAPLIVRRGAAPSLSLFPHNVRERSADWRTILVWHLGEGARVPCGHAASRRSTVASSTPGPSRRVRTGDFRPRDPGGFRRPSSGPYRPSFEGGPS